MQLGTATRWARSELRAARSVPRPLTQAPGCPDRGLAGFLLEELQIDKHGGCEHERAFVRGELTSVEGDAEAIGVRESLSKQPGPLLLDASQRALLALERERPRAPDGRGDGEQYTLGGVQDIEAFGQDREALLNGAEQTAVCAADFEPLEKEAEGVQRSQHEVSRFVEEMDLERAPMSEEHPREERQAALALFRRKPDLHAVDFDCVLVASLDAEELGELSALDYHDLVGALNGIEQMGHPLRIAYSGARREIRLNARCANEQLVPGVRARRRSACLTGTGVNGTIRFTDGCPHFHGAAERHAVCWYGHMASGVLRHSRLFPAVVGIAVALSVARPARAACGDFGGIGVMFGGAGGLTATLLGGFSFPAIALAAKPSLRYWPGVGYTMLAGAVGTVGGTVAVVGDCPYPESTYVPGVVALSLEALTTTIWAVASKSEPPPVALAVATPRSGEGAVLSVSGRF